jgi:hypothetical protein
MGRLIDWPQHHPIWRVATRDRGDLLVFACDGLQASRFAVARWGASVLYVTLYRASEQYPEE